MSVLVHTVCTCLTLLALIVLVSSSSVGHTYVGVTTSWGSGYEVHHRLIADVDTTTNITWNIDTLQVNITNYTCTSSCQYTASPFSFQFANSTDISFTMIPLFNIPFIHDFAPYQYNFTFTLNSTYPNSSYELLTLPVTLLFNLSTNLPPSFSLPASLVATGYEALPLHINLTDDMDNYVHTGIMQFRASLSSGTLYWPVSTGLLFTQGLNREVEVGYDTSSTWSIEAPLKHLKTALVNTLFYSSALPSITSSTLTLWCNDTGVGGVGGVGEVTAVFSITCLPGNKPPSLQMAYTSTSEDVRTRVTMLNITDPDYCDATLTIHLHADAGGWSVDNSSLATNISYAQPDAHTIDVTIAISQWWDFVSSHLWYVPANNWNSPANNFDFLYLQVIDAGCVGAAMATATKQYRVWVTPLNDAPTLNTNNQQSIYQAFPQTLEPILLQDVDADETIGATLLLNLTVQHGFLTLSTVGGARVISSSPSHVFSDASNVTAIVVEAPLSVLQFILQDLTYTSEFDFIGDDLVNITVNDQGNTGSGGALNAVTTIVLHVEPTNAGPTLIYPDILYGSEDTPSYIAQNISVYDVDHIGNATLTLTVSVTMGTITVNNSLLGCVIVDGTGYNDQSVTLNGSASALNQLFQSLTYLSPLNYDGLDPLVTFTVNDNGLIGYGGAQVTQVTLPLFISSVNDQPVILTSLPVVSPYQTFTQDLSQPVRGLSVLDVDVVQVFSHLLRVRLQTQSGTLSLGRDASQQDAQQLQGIHLINGSKASGSIIEFLASISNINYMLKHSLYYLSTPQTYGSDTFNFTIWDNGVSGAGGELMDTILLDFVISRVYDKLELSLLPTYRGLEDTPLALHSVTINDPDHIEFNMTALLTVQYGVLSVQSLISTVVAIPSSSSSRNLTLTGTVADIEIALNSSIVYQGDLHHNRMSLQTERVTIQYWYTTSSNERIVGDTRYADIWIDAVNDAPTLSSTSASFIAVENTPMPLSNISVQDVDFKEDFLGYVHATLVLDGIGELTTSYSSGLMFDSQCNSTYLSFDCTLSDLNRGFAFIYYLSPPDVYGASLASLSVYMSDGGHSGAGGVRSVSATFPIHVLYKDDLPTIAVQPQQYSTNEETPVNVMLQFTDMDSTLNNVTVTLNTIVVGAYFFMANPSLASIDYSILYNSNGTSTLTFQLFNTSISNYTNFNDIWYVPPLNHHSARLGRDVLGVTLQATNGALVYATGYVDVLPVNDAPTLLFNLSTVPSSIIQNTYYYTSPITFSDSDMDESFDASFMVSISVAHGTVSTNSTEGLTFLNGNGVDDRAMKFMCNLYSGLQALTSITYISDRLYAGSDAISVNITDNGHTGSGGEKFVTLSIPLTIIAVSTRPIITPPAYSYWMNEDSTLSITNITVIDENSIPSDIFTTTLQVNRGMFTLTNTTALSNVVFAVGDGINDTLVRFNSTLGDMNAVINNLLYSSPLHYNGDTTTLTVIVDDNGNTNSAPIFSQIVIQIFVAAVNDAPVITSSSSLTCYENSELSLSPLFVSDVDIDESFASKFLVYLQVHHGELLIKKPATGLFMMQGDIDTGSRILEFTASQSQLQSIMSSSLYYTPDSFWNGVDDLYISVSDQGATGIAAVLTSYNNFTIQVNKVNNPVFFHASLYQQATEDVAHQFTNLYLSTNETDLLSTHQNLTLSVAVWQGQIYFSLVDLSTCNVTITANPNGTTDATYVYAYHYVEINSDYAGLRCLLQSNGLYYISEIPYWNKEILIEFQLWYTRDDGLPLSSPFITTNANTTLQFTSVNNAPLWHLNLAASQPLSVVEQRELIITGVSVTDVDVRESNVGVLQVSLSCQYGTILLDSIFGLSLDSGFTYSPSVTANQSTTFFVNTGEALLYHGGASIQFTGGIDNINRALAAIHYVSDFDYFGMDNMTLIVSDLGYTGGGALTDATFILINNTYNASYPPVITASLQYTVYEDEILNIPISVFHRLPLSTFIFTLNSQLGSFSLSNTNFSSSPLNYNVSLINGTAINDDYMMFSTASLSDLNFALINLTYQSHLNANGWDEVTLSARCGPAISYVTLYIHVVAVNDAPTFTVPNSYTNLSSLTGSALTIGDITVDDVDVAESFGGNMRLTITTQYGYVYFTPQYYFNRYQTSLLPYSDLNPDAYTYSYQSFMFDYSSLSMLNSLLSSLHYRAPSSMPTAANDTISFQLNDNGNTGVGGHLTTNYTVSIQLLAANSPPSIHLPVASYDYLSVSYNIASQAISGVNVSDTDVGSNLLQFSIITLHGDIQLSSSAAGLNVSRVVWSVGSFDTWLNHIDLQAPLLDLNAMLTTLSYRPTPNYSGRDPAAIQFYSSDLGATGADGEKRSVAHLGVLVAPP